MLMLKSRSMKRGSGGWRKENKMSTNTKSPEPTLKANQESQGQVNLLDSALLLSHPTVQKGHPNVPPVRAQTSMIQLSEPEPKHIPEHACSAPPSAGTFFCSATPTISGLLASLGQKHKEDKPRSIALWAIHSMWSLATISSWAQLKGSSSPTVQEMAEEKKKKKKNGTVKKKKKKDETLKGEEENKE